MELTSSPAISEGELDELLGRAWRARETRFDREVRLSAPSFKHFRTVEIPTSGEPRFVAVSLTGRACSLGCDHCRGALLRSMAPAESPRALLDLAQRLVRRGCRGVLLSGGCDRRGRVPLEPFLEVIPELRGELGLEVAVHVGLADAAMARKLARAEVERVMVDLVGEGRTSREVLHLDAGPERFERSLETLLGAGLAVVPHVIAGLHRGELRGELGALEIAARHPSAAVALVVIRPEPGTPFARIAPPSPERVAELMARARLMLPETPLVLGCARPVGRASRALERYALRAGFNGLAFPADETVALARELGLRPVVDERCCAM